ncbi:MAG: dihydrofolate reductase family protein [Trueperaceae bacterium]
MSESMGSTNESKQEEKDSKQEDALGRSLRCTVYIGASLDGFIARKDGSIDWLLQKPLPGEDYGYQQFIDTVDVLVMGRGTFDAAMGFPQWPYASKPVTVLTTRALPANLPEGVSTDAGSPEEVVARLVAKGYRHAYVDGGVTVQRFLAVGLIDQLIVTSLPVLIGEGIPLFGPLPKDVWWQHQETQTYANGFVKSQYVKS